MDGRSPVVRSAAKRWSVRLKRGPEMPRLADGGRPAQRCATVDLPPDSLFARRLHGLLHQRRKQRMKMRGRMDLISKHIGLISIWHRVGLR